MLDHVLPLSLSPLLGLNPAFSSLGTEALVVCVLHGSFGCTFYSIQFGHLGSTFQTGIYGCIPVRFFFVSECRDVLSVRFNRIDELRRSLCVRPARVWACHPETTSSFAGCY